jgi:hypothetical protein
VSVLDAVRALLIRLVWLVLATLIAFGGAGIVGAMDHVPGSAGRPELTWAGDQAAMPAVDAATGQLEQLAASVDTLGSTARQALAQVVSGDLQSLPGTIAAGTIHLSEVEAGSAALRASLAAVPGTGQGAELRLSATLRRRLDELATAPDVTVGLAADWAAFAGRATDAASLTGLLTRHDQQTAEAAKAGGAAHYRDALDLLDESDAIIAKARALRDRLAPTTDTGTLTTWLDRNAAYDMALRALYQALLDSKGRVTTAVREAFAAEQAARALLPPDTRGIVVIMSDVAQGGLNQAVISIEQARGTLNAALLVQRQLQEGPQLPG